MVRYAILGPIGRLDGDRFVSIGAPRQLRLLAYLLIHANQAVSTDQLADALWDDAAADGGAKRVQMAIARLRKELAGDELRTVVGGYVLTVDALDATVFEEQVQAGGRALEDGDAAQAAELLSDSLRLWRGPALAEVRYDAWAQPEIRRLEELRLVAVESRVDADLRIGRHAAVTSELEALLVAHPERERIAGQLMLALYRCGRQGDALSVYQRTRGHLASELGLEPGPALKELQAQILSQDSSLDIAPVAPKRAGSDARRFVTVLAAYPDVADPEVLYAAFDRGTSIIERHGGTVEHYLGDVLVGLFGLDGSYGEHALRASQAAVELAGDLRVGIEGGEVFAARGAIPTGAPITAAARLAARAEAGEILVGEHARPAVARHALVDGERLIRLDDEPLRHAPATPFVGRTAELAALHAAFEGACEERGCRLVTLAGPPGIGKSRLIGEVVAALDATVLAGRCRSYGEGTTYRAVADIVGAIGADRARELLEGDEQAIRGILGAIGPGDTTAQATEIAWALRRLLERVATAGPLVVVVEDIHWAEPALLDLLDNLVTLSAGAPILVLCSTRPELLETHPAWAAPHAGRTLLMLDALTRAHAHDLADRLGGGERSDWIAARAEGNPLFVEHLVSAQVEHSAPELPASIQAVLAARIDALSERERTLLRRASVEGRTFHLRPLAAEDRPGLDAPLAALSRKGLITADRPAYPGEEAFRFTHALVRDAAYAGLLKRTRAEWHEDLADWLDQLHCAADEVVGFHLEQACALARQVGREPRRPDVPVRAIRRFEAASRSALARAEPAAASALIERALALSEPAERETLLPALGEAYFEAGRLDEAARLLDEAIGNATHDAVAARARVEREFVRLQLESERATQQAGRAAGAALRVLNGVGDTYGQCRAWCLRAQAGWIRGQVVRADTAWDAASALARRAGDDRVLFDVLGWRATAAVLGSAHVDVAIRSCEAWREEVFSSPVALAWILNPLASLCAMRGDLEAAELYLEEANATLSRLGSLGASASHHAGLVFFLAGQPAAMEAVLRPSADTLAAMGDAGGLATTTAMLAQAVYALDRVDEAERLCLSTAETAAPDDILTQVIWRGVMAKTRARQDRHTEAEALAREGIRLIEDTDLLSARADALLELGEVLRLGDRGDEAAEAVIDGLRLYEAKGNAIGTARARALLDTVEREGEWRSSPTSTR